MQREKAPSTIFEFARTRPLETLIFTSMIDLLLLSANTSFNTYILVVVKLMVKPNFYLALKNNNKNATKTLSTFNYNIFSVIDIIANIVFL